MTGGDAVGALKSLNPEQARGADPAGNAWLSASAGTGKTQVLTARVLRLLLEGVRPEHILCITFTKAGASEMARRIRQTLARWVQIRTADLKDDLFAIGARNIHDAETIDRARTLFAEVIDAPGQGLAIQTIHSFCQSLLAGFPQEAKLAPGFRALEAGDAARLQQDVLNDLIANAERAGDQAFVAQLGALALDIGEEPASRYLYRCARALAALEALGPGIQPRLRDHLGLGLSEPEAWLAARCGDDHLDVAGWRAVAAGYVGWRTATGDAKAGEIGAILALSAEGRAAALPDLVATVTKKGDGTLLAVFANPKQLGDCADLAQRLVDAAQALLAAASSMREVDRLAAALDCGRRFARAYAARKAGDGIVDFDDLIAKTVALLEGEGRAEWIRYKLDSRIDHILLDEAQDTNVDQWRIVNALSEEYFAGQGAKGNRSRTVFVVGDYKQAIFAFQGTDPRNFEHAKQRYQIKSELAALAFTEAVVTTNFRSSPPILAAVDRVIAHLGPDKFGLPADAVITHSAFASKAPGSITVWPVQAHGRDGDSDDDSDDDDGDDEDGWFDAGRRKVADGIARSVSDWVANGIDGTPVSPGDVLILLRSRGDLASLIVSRLQAANVPVAGVDRLRLQKPLAVQDLMAAARFALQPLDDLNLAELLVSPLVGWSHDDLIAYGHRPANADGRGRVALWPHLRGQSGLRDAIAPLYDLLNMAGYVTPYRFFETILSGPMRGRTRLLARLGNAARDPIEELVSQALAFETREGASLHQFIRWFDGNDTDIVRELDGASAAVRVMTVHGSKGLQARIVILADAADDPKRKQVRADSGPDWRYGEPGADATVKVPLLAKGKDQHWPAPWQEAADAAATADLEENRRLLYVAMTRAERMLFVAGRLAKNAKDGTVPEASWYSAISAIMPDMGAVSEADAVWRSRCVVRVAGSEAKTAKVAPAAAGVTIPDWMARAAPAEARPARPLTPSALVEAAELSVAQPPLSAARMAAAERGRLLHSLFERLPAVEASRRGDVATDWLATQAPGIAAAERRTMVDEVLSVIDDPQYAPLFGPESLAEVPFSALVDGQVIAGAVDRLLVTETGVRIVDFKTGAHVPATADAVQAGYVRQMAAYVAALRVIFPGRHVEAALLFTAGPRLIAVPDALMDRHKPSFSDA